MRPAFQPQKLADELRDFFGEDPLALPIVSRTFSPVDLPNLHLAIQAFARDRKAELRIIGYVGAMQGFQDKLRDLIAQNPRMGEVTTGPVQYRSVAIDYEQELSCVESGLHLLHSAAGKVVAHVRRDLVFSRGAMELEVMAREPAATAFSAEIRDRVQRSSVYRGKIVALDTPEDPRQITAGLGGVAVSFQRFPPVTRDQIILPEALLALLERNTLGFLRHAETLRRSGRSVKRGLLLHGPPGTGKTLTAKWLAQTIPNVTVILLSAEQLGLVKECCRLARALAPSLVIMEDVDLIASHRDETRHPSAHVLLHQLLNEMDGLAANAEVIFLLTTNRPDVLEPALASRPGRIDQAIEFPLPDAECRRRLLELYGQGLTLALADPDRLLSKTEGASPAFIQELVRKAALFAAEEGSSADGVLRLTDRHFDAAVEELVLGGGALTRNLLGFATEKGDSQA